VHSTFISAIRTCSGHVMDLMATGLAPKHDPVYSESRQLPPLRESGASREERGSDLTQQATRLQTMSIAVGGRTYPTMKDAAPEFGVSPKQVYEWIKEEVIPQPPTVTKGRKEIMTFPPE
jgi:hypothetical protein